MKILPLYWKQKYKFKQILGHYSAIKKQTNQKLWNAAVLSWLSDITPVLYSSVYEVSWQVMKWKGQEGNAFIRSKPIGQVSTFHALTAAGALLSKTIHSPWPLIRHITNSSSHWQCHAQGLEILQDRFTARVHPLATVWYKQCVM